MRTTHKLHFVAALCAAAGCSSAFAQSTGNVTISGIVDAYAGTRQLAGGDRVTKVDSSGMSTSQLNFAGSEDLGGGLRGEFVLGMFFRPDGGQQGRFDGDVFWSRSAYVGIGSPLGTVRLGRQTTPTFLNYIRTNAFGDSTTFGPVFVQTWVAAISQGTQFLGTGAPPARRTLTNPMGTSDTTWNNVVSYISPSIGGTVFQAQWAPGEGGGVGSRYSASAFYNGGPLMVGLSTEHIGDKSVPAAGPAAAVISSQSTWELTGAYAFSFGRLNAGVLHTSRDYESIADDSILTVHIGASIPVGRGTVMAAVANSRQDPDVGRKMTRTTTSVGYSYAFSKRTDVYSVVMNDRFTDQDSGNSVGLGIRHRF